MASENLEVVIVCGGDWSIFVVSLVRVSLLQWWVVLQRRTREELEGKGGARRFTSLCVANPDVVRWQDAVLTDYEVNEGV